MRLIIVRHGETTHNADGVLMGGATDAPLSELGIKQSRLTALRLRDVTVNVLYSSDLGRSLATAEIVAAQHPGLSVKSTALLRERNLGNFQGRLRHELFEAEKQAPNLMEWKPTGGESLHEVKARVQTWFEEVKEKYFHQTVLVISHGLLITILLEVILGKHDDGLDAYRHKNCAVSIIDLDASGQATVSCLLDESHLW